MLCRTLECTSLDCIHGVITAYVSSYVDDAVFETMYRHGKFRQVSRFVLVQEIFSVLVCSFDMFNTCLTQDNICCSCMTCL